MTTALVYAQSVIGPYQVLLPSGAIVGWQSSSNVQFISMTGLRDLPDIRTGDQPKGQLDGVYPGLNNLGARTVQITWDTTSATYGVESALNVLAQGFQSVHDPSTVVMTAGDYLRQIANVGPSKPVSALAVKLPQRAYPIILFGRPEKHGVPMDINYQFGQSKPVTQWVCPDGAIYDMNVVSGQCGLPAPTTGHAWGTAWPWSWGTSTGGSFQLNNTGLYQSTPLFVIQGPCSYPVIRNSNTGQSLAFNIVLGSSDQLTVDCQSGVVTLNATANRNNTVRVGSTFFQCAAAGVTTIGFSSSDSTQVTGTLTGYILPTNSTI